jgi:hypothetical protein
VLARPRYWRRQKTAAEEDEAEAVGVDERKTSRLCTATKRKKIH